MKRRIHSGIATICLAFAAITAPAIAGAQEVVLDASVEVGAKQSQNKQYTATIGKEITLEENNVYRMVMIVDSVSSKIATVRFRMFNPSSGKLMAWADGKPPLGGEKKAILEFGVPGEPARFKLDGVFRLK